MTAYTLTFGQLGQARPVPPVTLPYEDADSFTRAVNAYAQPHLKPALEAEGRPELIDCLFHMNADRTEGYFLWMDLANGVGARFCAARIEKAS